MEKQEKLVSLVLLVGELLLTSGAEIYRVEETVERVGKNLGFSPVDILCTPTGIFLSLTSPNGRVYTRVRRIRQIDNNLTRISTINALSRQLAQGMAHEEFSEKIQGITGKETMSQLWLSLAGGFGSGAFAIIFGGRIIEAGFAALIGACVLYLVRRVMTHPAPRVLASAVGASLAATLGLFGESLLGLSADVTILSGVMVLVPGVTMTTAVRDMLSGELLSGVARGAEALTIAVSVAVGVALVLSIGGL